MYTFLKAQYTPLCNKITRPNNNNVNEGSCIDNIFVKTKSASKIYKLNQVFCDHFPIVMSIEVNMDRLRPNSQAKFLNYKKLNSITRKQPCHNLFSIHDPDIATNEFIAMIDNTIEKAQTKKRNTRNKANSMPCKQWLTQRILFSCKTKETLYKLWGAKPDCEELELNYKKYEKILAKIIEIAKYTFEQEKIHKCGRDYKKLWNYINRNLNTNKKNKNTKMAVIKEGNIVLSKKTGNC